jgi:hypothetical protein
MKKSLLVLGVAAMFGLGITSCNKCQTCGDCPDGLTFTEEDGTESTEVEICEDDADSKEEYDAAIALFEAFGCTCN